MLLIWSSTGSIAWTSRPLTAVLFNRAGAAEMWMLIVVMVYSTVPDVPPGVPAPPPGFEFERLSLKPAQTVIFAPTPFMDAKACLAAANFIEASATIGTLHTASARCYQTNR